MTNFTKEQTLWQGATGGLVVYTGWDRVGKKGDEGVGKFKAMFSLEKRVQHFAIVAGLKACFYATVCNRL